MKGAARENPGQSVAGVFCVRELRASKAVSLRISALTEPPLYVPSMALRGFGGRPVRQFLMVSETAKKP